MTTKTTADVQRALIARGYDLGRGGPSGKGDDGIPGAKTRAAVVAFQKSVGLAGSGIVGSSTLSALFPDQVLGPTLKVQAPWMAVANSLKGTTEISGPKNSSIIMGWAEKLKLWYPNDETAWCGLFVAHCMSTALPGEPQPSNPLGARNWAKFGRSLSEPQPGAVVVFWRGTRDGWLGHVGFYVGERPRDGALRILGGNQGNTVREDWLGSDRILAIRWPGSYSLPAEGRVYLADNGKPLSTNEA